LWRLAKPPISVGFLQLINNSNTNKKTENVDKQKITTVARNGTVIETPVPAVTIEAEIVKFGNKFLKVSGKQLSMMGSMVSSMSENFPARFLM
jgi:hypothetical protein